MQPTLSTLRNKLRARKRPETRIARAYRKWLKHERQDAPVTNGPLISVLLPVFNPPLPFLRAAILSVRNQAYKNWELCIADDASPAGNVAQAIAEAAAQDTRIKQTRLPENAGIAAATNTALAMATGDFLALLDHDDELAPHALARVAAELVAAPEKDILFSDEDQIEGARRCRPYFKPGWNPDLMLSQNLVSHLGVYRRTLIERIGGMRPDFPGSQDYDLALRATASVPASRIKHVPEVLYHWRQHPNAFSKQRAAQCQQSARAALAAHLGDTATVEPNPDLPQWTRIAYPVPEPAPLVSLILPPGAAPPENPGYAHIEICTGDPATAHGEVLVFLPYISISPTEAKIPSPTKWEREGPNPKGWEGEDSRPERPGWLHELVTQALRPEIACAGPRLDGPDGRIANSGLTLHPEEIAQTLAPPSDFNDPGYLGHFRLTRTVSALSMAGLTVRRSIFLELGGFDPRAGAFADVDFCLRAGELGLRCVWTPHARLRYHVLPPARDDANGARFMRERWCKTLAHDPYANPNLVVRTQNLYLAEPKKDVLF